MKSLFFVAALSVVGMSVEGASVITPNIELWNNTTITDFQAKCISKIQNDENSIEDILNIQFTFVSVFTKITQKIREQNSLDSLDTMINDICYPALDEDRMYSLTMQIFKICLNEEDPFSAEEKQIIKTKLQRAFCSVYLKLGAVVTFSNDCLSNEATTTGILKCIEGQNFLATTFRDFFFATSDVCSTQAKALDCVNQTIKGQTQCPASISENIESILSEAQKIMGCESDPNSISVINSL